MNRIVKLYLLSFFFVLMMVIPTAYQEIRGVFLGFLFFGSFIFIEFKKLIINRDVLILFIINILISFFFFLLGFINEGPGAIRTTTVYLLWPLLYLYFIFVSRSDLFIKKINSIIILGGIISSILIMLFIYSTFFPFPISLDHLKENLDFKSNFLYDGFSQVHSANLTTVFYVVPFMLSIMMLPSKYKLNINKSVLFISFITCFFLIILSGRRAFWIVLIISPLIVYFYFILVGIKFNYKFILLLATIFILSIIIYSIYNFNLDVVKSQFSSLFEFDDPNSGVGASNYIRKIQYQELIISWKESPIFGKGFGTVAGTNIRDENQTWAYELSYIALLFHTGIFGIIIYTSSVFWILISSIKIMKKVTESIIVLLPLNIGLICFLLINASNPYLEKFDFLWVLFLPVYVINYFKTRKVELNA